MTVLSRNFRIEVLPRERLRIHLPDHDDIEVAWQATIAPDATDVRTAVLVHGALAHAHWWDHLSPGILALGFNRVVAIDLSGHGRSGWRTSYSRAAWANELIALARHLELDDSDVVIGHSLGGAVALEACQAAPDAWGPTVLVDAVVDWGFPRGSGGPKSPFRGNRADAKPSHNEVDAQPMGQRFFPTRTAASERFRLVPPQDGGDPEIMRHIARESVRLEEGVGWTWRFDPRLLGKPFDPPLSWGETAAHDDLAYIRGEHSVLVPEERFAAIVALLGPHRALTVPDAHHHVILDHPDGFLEALGRVLTADA